MSPLARRLGMIKKRWADLGGSLVYFERLPEAHGHRDLKWRAISMHDQQHR